MIDHTPDSWGWNKRHWKDKAAAFSGRYTLRPILSLPIPPRAHRKVFEYMGRRRALADGVIQTHWVDGRPGSCLFTPPDPKRRILWFHGGGFIVGSPRSYRAMLSQIAVLADAQVIAPSYRLMPEHRFPAAAEDAIAAADTAWDHAPDVGPLIVAGDSAGGNLGAVALSHLLAQEKRPAAAIFASPATWMDPDRPVPPAREYVFPAKLLQGLGRAYAGQAQPDDPRLSPSQADFPNAPPTLIHCSKGELLETDTNLLAARLETFGSDVTVERAPAIPHVWHYMASDSPLAMDALTRMGDFAKAHG